MRSHIVSQRVVSNKYNHYLSCYSRSCSCFSWFPGREEEFGPDDFVGLHEHIFLKSRMFPKLPSGPNTDNKAT